jgi:DNA ligase 4
MKDLQNWKTSDGLDFASCVERVMVVTDCEPSCGPNVTLEELDDILDQIAATSAFSSVRLKEKIRKKYGRSARPDDLLSKIFRVLKSSEAKWLVRMLSKNYSPVCVPEWLAMRKERDLQIRFDDTSID